MFGEPEKLLGRLVRVTDSNNINGWSFKIYKLLNSWLKLLRIHTQTITRFSLIVELTSVIIKIGQDRLNAILTAR